MPGVCHCKQTNCCQWGNYIFGIATFIYLVLMFILENVLFFTTFILTCGCKYYSTKWSWYTTMTRIKSQTIDHNNLDTTTNKHPSQYLPKIILMITFTFSKTIQAKMDQTITIIIMLPLKY